MAFAVAAEGIEQVELTEPWKAVQQAGGTPRLVSTDSGQVMLGTRELSIDKLPVVALAIGLGWPVLAYICGLYALDDLRSWASGVGDAPRLAVTSLLMMSVGIAAWVWVKPRVT